MSVFTLRFMNYESEKLSHGMKNVTDSSNIMRNMEISCGISDRETDRLSGADRIRCAVAGWAGEKGHYCL